MMKKLLHKLNLYEKYNQLVTEEGKKIFIRTVYTLSICTVAIILIWYCGIVNISTKNNNSSLPGQLQNSNVTGLSNQTVTLLSKTGANNTAGKIQPSSVSRVATTSGPAIESAGSSAGNKINENKNNKKKDIVKTTDKKNDGKNQLLKTIYAGANRPNVALTFDDGYNKQLVIKVLDTLKKNNIKATFFIIGRVLDEYPDVWKRAINEGHQICNHTAYHETLTNMSDQKVKNEIMGWETYVKKDLGEEYLKKMKKEFPYLRLPGGGGQKSQRILSIAQSCGYTVIGWNVETFSSVINPMRKNHTVAEIAVKTQQHVVNRCSSGSIILLHFNSYDITNIDGIIAGIKKKGYGIQNVSQVIMPK